MSEYKWTLEYARDEVPLVTMFALYRAIACRYDTDGAGGPTFEEDDMLENMNGWKRAIRAALRDFKKTHKPKDS